MEEEWSEGAEHPEVRVHRVQWTQRWGGTGEGAQGSRDMRERVEVERCLGYPGLKE